MHGYRGYALLAIFGMMFVLSPLPAFADSTLTLGGAGGTSTDPFGGGTFFGSVTTSLEHEDIYGASAFSSVGAVTFTSLDYTVFNFGAGNPGADAMYDVTIGMSTTTVSASNPFPNFAENRGPDYTTVFTGNLDIVPPISTELVFPISPFNYDPSNGNLLIDLKVSSTITNASLVNVINDPNLTTFDQSDVFIEGGTTSTVITGDHSSAVQFGYVKPAATPEPNGIVPIGLGCLCVSSLIECTRRRSLVSRNWAKL